MTFCSIAQTAGHLDMMTVALYGSGSKDYNLLSSFQSKVKYHLLEVISNPFLNQNRLL